MLRRLSLVAIVACSSQSAAPAAPPPDSSVDDAAVDDLADTAVPTSFTDPRDGRVYPLVVIGTQTWLGENLHYQTGCICYDNLPANCETYGCLYLFPDASKACPAGWHVPSDDEWKTLETTLGMAADQLDIQGYSTPRGTTEGAALKLGGSSGFNGKLAGYAAGTLFDSLNLKGYFWSSTMSAGQVFRRRLDSSTPILYRFQDVTGTYADSLRCLMD